ncbi:MAG: DUF2863 family protein [Betaproteobacteria bacterium]|nr:DUF2863 family protein [Betaproteobacteria bacterium]
MPPAAARGRVWGGRHRRTGRQADGRRQRCALESALDRTFQSNLAAHDVLIELVEACCTSTVIEVNGARWGHSALAMPPGWSLCGAIRPDPQGRGRGHPPATARPRSRRARARAAIPLSL